MEQRVCKVSATVMIYNDQDRRWLHAGENSGSNISTISILVNEATSKYRIVAQKQDPPREVTVNMNIQKSLRYHVATPTFHQWRDSKIVYGLNFISEEHAQDFSNKLQSILQNLKMAAQQPPQNYNPNEAYNNPRLTQQYAQQNQAPMVKPQYNNQPKLTTKNSNPMLATSSQNLALNGNSFRQEQNFSNFNSQQNYPTEEMKQMQIQDSIRQEQKISNTESLDDNLQYPQKKVVQEVKEPAKTFVPPPPPPPPGPGISKPNGAGPPPPPGPPPMGNGTRPTLPNSLQDQIKGFGNLKKPTSSTPPQPKSAPSSGGGDFMSELRKKLERNMPNKRSEPLQSFNTITPTKQEIKAMKPKSLEESNKISVNATNSERDSPLTVNRFNSTIPKDNFENKIDQILSAVQCLDSNFDKMKSELKMELCDEFRKIVREELNLMFNVKSDN